MRQGYSLLELLVTMAILALAIGLIIPAVIKVRESASVMRTLNTLKQLQMATLQHGETLGTYGGYLNYEQFTFEQRRNNPEPETSGNPQMVAVMLLAGNGQTSQFKPQSFYEFINDSSDPSVIYHGYFKNHQMIGPTSFAFNAIAYQGPLQKIISITDGTSCTISYSTAYYRRVLDPVDDPNGAYNYQDYGRGDSALMISRMSRQLDRGGARRPSFADKGWDDVYPITRGNPAISIPSRPLSTFQNKPAVLKADASLLQSFTSGGLSVAFFDGSARNIKSNIQENAFWSMVTPHSGDVCPIE